MFLLKKREYNKWVKNTITFLLPALLVAAVAFLGALADLLPEEAVWTPLALYAINVLIDYIKKLKK